VQDEMARQYMFDFLTWALDTGMRTGIPNNTLDAGRRMLAALQNPQQMPIKKEEEKKPPEESE
jgi:hypothetical protein